MAIRGESVREVPIMRVGLAHDIHSSQLVALPDSARRGTGSFNNLLESERDAGGKYLTYLELDTAKRASARASEAGLGLHGQTRRHMLRPGVPSVPYFERRSGLSSSKINQAVVVGVGRTVR